MIKVKSVKSFGVLVQLDFETVGLIHESELKGKTFKYGDVVNTKVASINKNQRKVNLTIV